MLVFIFVRCADGGERDPVLRAPLRCCIDVQEDDPDDLVRAHLDAVRADLCDPQVEDLDARLHLLAEVGARGDDGPELPAHVLGGWPVGAVNDGLHQVV